MLLRMISAPRWPSSTTRVGATSRSPIPALAVDGKATKEPATRLAASTDLVHLVISAIPTYSPLRRDHRTLAPEWFIFGQPCAVPRRKKLLPCPPKMALIVDSD